LLQWFILGNKEPQRHNDTEETQRLPAGRQVVNRCAVGVVVVKK
jgi:hypothetical protein